MISLNLLPPFLLKKLRAAVASYSLWHFKLTGRVPYPRAIIIDPINICNLHCPLCPTGAKKLKLKQQAMPFSLFKKIVDQIPTLKHISLFNWGEPFLNPQVFKMIAYAKKKGILISLHSNLNLEKDINFFKKIIQSGLDDLEISLDGASPEIYVKFRRGGNFQLVIKNLKTLARIKNELQATKPRLTWKFIVSRYNEHEIEKARQMATEIGVNFATDYLEVGDLNLDTQFDKALAQRMQEWLPKNKKYQRELYASGYHTPLLNRKCDQLFTTLTINPDGTVFPCCYLADPKNTFGDLSRESFKDVWNNKKYTYSRNLFARKNKIRQTAEPISTICEKCSIFKK